MTTAEYFEVARPPRHRPLGDFGTAFEPGEAAGSLTVLVDAFVGFYGRVARWHKLRRGVGELSRLDDRMLKDIGLSRSSLYASARDGFGVDGAGYDFR